MAFHDLVRFPTTISRGARGGPQFRTDIVRTDSGGDERVSRWPAPKRFYNARYGIRTYADLYDVLSFFIAREGTLNGFRYKDWLDYTTAANGRNAPSTTDVLIGTGDGATRDFQLIKEYEPGPYVKQRALQKPVAGTVVAALNAATTTAFTVNTSTGIITFNSAPAAGVQITAGCEFDVPCQFGESLSAAALQASLDSHATGSVTDIPIEEQTSGITVPEQYYHGDGAARVIQADSRFDWAWGQAVVLVPTTNVKVIMPDTLDLEPGIHYPYFYNAAVSPLTITFRDNADANTLWTLGQNIGALSLVYTSSGVRFWGAVGG